MRSKFAKFPTEVFSYYFNIGKISKKSNKNLWNELMTQKFKDLEISYLSGGNLSNANFISAGNDLYCSKCNQKY